MSILLIADVDLSTPCSGSEQVLYQQAQGLMQRQSKVYAISRKNGNGDSVEYLNGENLKIRSYSADVNHASEFFISLFKNVPQSFDQFSAETFFSIAISHQPYTCFALLVTKRLAGVPMLYYFHSPSHEEYLLTKGAKDGGRRFFQAWARRIIEGYCLRKSTKIFALSRYMKHRAIDIHRIADEKIIVNPGGVDLDRFFPPEKRILLKTKLGLPDGCVNLFTVRNLEPRMGLDNLIKAMSLLKKKGTKVHLVIGGRGQEEKRLKDLIEQERLQDDVRMAGFIPADQLPNFYGAADFFVLPTLRLEGFGLVTVESLACGTPVLGTPVGGTKEILNKFQSNLLFKDSSPESMATGVQFAVEKLFTDTCKYKQLRQRCRDYVLAHYSWRRHISQLEAVIEELALKKN
jgi:glycosyltransferase involved in cell wall biosynthesis